MLFNSSSDCLIVPNFLKKYKYFKKTIKKLGGDPKNLVIDIRMIVYGFQKTRKTYYQVLY